MKFKAWRLPRVWSILQIVAVLIVCGAGQTVSAQDDEPRVVDEVVAQVNTKVITLANVKREMREAVETLKQQGGMNEEQATAEVAKRQSEIIANLINEQLLLQKGDDLGLTNDVEAEVNKRLLEIAKQQNITTIEGLNQAMIATGLKPELIRSTMRADLMKNFVFFREVDQKIYSGISPEEVRKYYDANRPKFVQPETVTLSEIFLSTAGRPAAEIQAKAAALVQQARQSGADFGALAVANSEREANNARVAPESKGKIGRFEVPNLRDDIAAAVKNVKVGGVTDPIPTPEGLVILRVDERTTSADVAFNENRVREVMTTERAAREREVYISNLRNDSYVRLAENYRAAVEPLLKKTIETPAAITPSTTAAPTPVISVTPTKSATEKKPETKKP